MKHWILAAALALAALLPAPRPARAQEATSAAAADTLPFIAGLPGSRSLAPGVVTSGQPPESLFAELANGGYRTVLDLRSGVEARGYAEPRAVKRAGLRYINVPVTPGTLGENEFDWVRRVLNAPKRRPVLVHCATGNRAGAALLPWLVLDRGLPVDSAVVVARRAGLHSESMQAKALDYIARAKPRRR